VRLTVPEWVRLVDARQGAGHHRIIFEAGSLPSGVYGCRLKTDSFAAFERMLLLR